MTTKAMTTKERNLITRLLTLIENNKIKYAIPYPFKEIICEFNCENRSGQPYKDSILIRASFFQLGGAVPFKDKEISSRIDAILENARKAADDHRVDDVNKILDDLESDQAKNFGNTLFNIAKDTKPSFKEVAETAVEFCKKGLSVESPITETEKTVLRILEKIELGDLNCAISDGIIKVAINSFDVWIGYSTLNIDGVVIPTNNKDIMKKLSVILGKLHDSRAYDALERVNKVLDSL